MKIEKAIIPAAGLGTRFLPVTKAIPKPMLPIVDKPSIHYIVEEAVEAGIKDIVIVVSGNTDSICSYFEENSALENKLKEEGKKELYRLAAEPSRLARIRFVTQNDLNGLAGAVLCAERLIGNEPFALLLGDEVIAHGAGETPCIKKLADICCETNKSVIATMRVPKADLPKYGNLGIHDQRADHKIVTKIIEKPRPGRELSDYAIIGRYVFTNEIFDYIKKSRVLNGEIYLTDALSILASKSRLLATDFDGVRYDIGDKAGYVCANIDFALRRGDLKEQIEEKIRELSVRI